MTNESKQQWIVWWVLWAAILTGMFVIYHFLGGTAAPSRSPSLDSLSWLAGLAPFVISSIIRWVVLPRIRNAQAALVLFIFGLAMSEATCFLGLFIFPAHKQALFALSVLGILQFVPSFARRFFEPDDKRPKT